MSAIAGGGTLPAGMLNVTHAGDGTYLAPPPAPGSPGSAPDVTITAHAPRALGAAFDGAARPAVQPELPVADMAALRHLIGVFSPRPGDDALSFWNTGAGDGGGGGGGGGGVFEVTPVYGSLVDGAAVAPHLGAVQVAHQGGGPEGGASVSRVPVGLLLWAVFQYYATAGEPLRSYALSLAKFRRLVKDLALVVPPMAGPIRSGAAAEIARRGRSPAAARVAAVTTLDVATATREQLLDPRLLAPERRRLCSLEALEVLFVSAASSPLPVTPAATAPVSAAPHTAFEASVVYRTAVDGEPGGLAASGVEGFDGAGTRRVHRVWADASGRVINESYDADIGVDTTAPPASGVERVSRTPTRATTPFVARVVTPGMTARSRTPARAAARESALRPTSRPRAREVSVAVEGATRSGNGGGGADHTNLSQSTAGGAASVVLSFAASAAVGARATIDFAALLSVLEVAVARRFGRDRELSWRLFATACLLPLADDIGRRLLDPAAAATAAAAAAAATAATASASIVDPPPTARSGLSPARRRGGTTAGALATVRPGQVAALIGGDAEVRRLLAINDGLLRTLFATYAGSPGLGAGRTSVFEQRAGRRAAAAAATAAAGGSGGGGGLMDVSQLAAFARDFGLLGVVCNLAEVQQAFVLVAGTGVPLPAAGDDEPAATPAGSGFIDLLDLRGFRHALVALALACRYTATGARDGASRLAALLERLEASGGRDKVARSARSSGFLGRFRW